MYTTEKWWGKDQACVHIIPVIYPRANVTADISFLFKCHGILCFGFFMLQWFWERESMIRCLENDEYERLWTVTVVEKSRWISEYRRENKKKILQLTYDGWVQGSNSLTRLKPYCYIFLLDVNVCKSIVL